jgi:RHS repeat-associated protein
MSSLTNRGDTPPGHAAVVLSSVANIYQTDPACAGGTQTTPPYTVVLCSSVTQSSDVDGTPFPSATTSYTYDNSGNVLTSTTLVSDGSSKVTTNTWLNDTTNWFLGRLLTSCVQSSIPGSATLTRHSAFTYDPASGLVTAEIMEPQDTGALRLETDYTYDTFGNKHITTVTGLAATPGGLATQSRAVTATFDARGQFATTIANALSESEQWSYNGDYGTPASHTGPNGIPTTWAYDTFGRVTRETKADGTQTAFSYVYCSVAGSCPANGAYFVQATPLAPDGVTVAGATSIAYYDSLSRAIATDTASFDTGPSPWIRSETHYDSFGRAAQASRPYFLGVDAPVWTVSSYTVAIAGDTVDPDPLARAWHVTAPDGSISAYTYDALSATVTNALGAVTATVKNAQGLVAQVTDAKGQITSYAYDSFGDMVTANPPGAYILRNTYDLRGRKLTANDSDMGLWHYSTDAFGALYQQTDAKSQVATMGYDPLGRLVARTEPDMVSAWAYGTSAASHNIDQLVSASCASGASGNACGPGYSRAYAYDSIGRPSQLTLSTAGINYHSISTYDPTTGQLASARNFSGFTLDYSYSARGYLTSIRDDANSSLVYWTANARNAAMQLTQSMAGNGVVTIDSFGPLTGRMLNVCSTNHSSGCDGGIANISTDFDAVGNLTIRGDMLHGVNEGFTYDTLNRLSTSSLTGPGTNLSRTMRYDSAGNITEKSDVCAVNGCLRYDGSQPHAVSAITGTVNGVVNPTYAYDLNGNMTGGAGRSAAWTSFNMVSSVQQGTTNVALLYDEGHARLQQTAPEGTTQYLNDPSNGVMTERFAPTGGGLYWKSYILADGKIIAERSVKGSIVTVRYFTLDHLGSTVALTDEHGALAESDGYDAWGKQRNATTGADDATCSIPATDFSTRGFTGHEQIADLCLVNMNARVYDPTIGRFMSPDDVTSDLYDGQSFNRYTYVDNNPLSYTDPTGHDLTANFGQIFIQPAPEEVPGYAHRGEGDDSWRGGFPGPNMSPDPYWPHIEAMHTGPSSSGFGNNGAHATSTGLTSPSKSQSGLNSTTSDDDSDALPIAGPQDDNAAGNIQLAENDPARDDPKEEMPGSTIRDYEEMKDEADQKEAADNAARLNELRANGAETKEDSAEAIAKAQGGNSPVVDPYGILGLTPAEIDQISRDLGLIPRGPDPMNGRGSYIDPETGNQRVLIHPSPERGGPHAHVNDAEGYRIDVNGQRVPEESPQAHLPIRR